MNRILNFFAGIILLLAMLGLQGCGGGSSRHSANDNTDTSGSNNSDSGSTNNGSNNNSSDSGSSNNGSTDSSGNSGGSGGTSNSGSDSGSTSSSTSDSSSSGSSSGSSDSGNDSSSDNSQPKDPDNTVSGDYASEWNDSYPEVIQYDAGTSPAGKFRIDALGNITEDGAVFPVRCGNWFGLDGQQEPKNSDNNPDGAPMELYIGNMWWFNSSQGSGRSIDQNMQEIKNMGINMIRLPISPQTLSSTHPQGMGDASQKNGGALKNHPGVQQENALDGLQEFLLTADKYDVKVLIDVHSCSNYVGWRAGRIDAAPPWVDANRTGYQFGRENWSCNAADTNKQVTINGQSVTMNVDEYNESMWLADLQKIALLPSDLGIDNVIGIDIFNEPWEYTWDEWSTLAEKAYEAINSVNKDVLIFVEGIGKQSNYGATEAYNPNWGENLHGFAADPLNIPQDRLVLSPHTYAHRFSFRLNSSTRTNPNVRAWKVMKQQQKTAIS